MPPKAKPIPLPPEGYSWPELYRLVGTTLRTGLSVLLRGHPGVGKSTLAQALATDFGLPLIDIRHTQNLTPSRWRGRHRHGSPPRCGLPPR